MKKLLLALFAVAAFGALAPHAQAGQFAEVYTKHGVVYVPKAVLYGQSYIDEVARNAERARCEAARRRAARARACYEEDYAPVYRRSCETYSAPVYHRSCDTHRSSRLSFFFGF